MAGSGRLLWATGLRETAELLGRGVPRVCCREARALPCRPRVYACISLLGYAVVPLDVAVTVVMAVAVEVAIAVVQHF